MILQKTSELLGDLAAYPKDYAAITSVKAENIAALKAVVWLHEFITNDYADIEQLTVRSAINLTNEIIKFINERVIQL